MSAPQAVPFPLEIDVRLRMGPRFTLDAAFRTTSPAVALFGPSGSGKTTLLRLLAGLSRPDRGRIAVGDTVFVDRDAGRWEPPRARKVGLVVQEGMLFPLLDVRRNLLFGAPKGGGRLALDHVAELLEIPHLLDRRPRNLSGGERQRVALGRAILSEPRLLLCDEPFAALDDARRERMIEVLRRVRSELSLPMVLVTHRMAEVQALADEIVVLDDGRVESCGPVAPERP